MIKISVIVPAYNAGEYLEECLERISRQSLKDIEIICVDDASLDDTSAIIRRMAIKDDRVRPIFLEKNIGSGGARNAALDIASGEYVGFVDADDYPEDDYFFERLYNEAIWNKADAVKGNYRNSDAEGFFCEQNAMIRKDCRYFVSDFCSAIFKKSLIDERHIRFPLLRRMEDPVFTQRFSMHARKIVVCDNASLFIRKKPFAQRKPPTPAMLADSLKGLRLIMASMNSDPDFPEDCYAWIFAYWYDQLVRWALDNLCASMEDQLFRFFCNALKDMKHKDAVLEQIRLRNPELHEYLLKGVYPLSSNLKLLKALIARADVVSFDVFDTLLLRPFLHPTDLFEYLGDLAAKPEFSWLRPQAEAKARRKLFLFQKSLSVPGRHHQGLKKEDVTLDEIYNMLPAKYKHLKEQEIELEIALSRPNPEMLECYELALKLGKKIILTSDMYLPKEVIEEMLRKNGITGYAKLYLSCDCGDSKHNGTVYGRIIRETGAKPSKILHVGDNPHADVNAASAYGLQAFQYVSPPERFKRSFENRFRFENGRNDECKAAFGLEMLDWASRTAPKDYFHRLGYAYGGPLAVNFCLAIHEIAKRKDLTDLVFAARDGYSLIKTFKILFPDSEIKTHYIAANRYLINGYRRSPKSLEGQQYEKYIKELPMRGFRCGIIDTTTTFHTVQSLLKDVLKCETFGIYVSCKADFNYDYINLSNYPQTALYQFFGWDIIEVFLTAPSPPIRGVNSSGFIYKTPNTIEIKNIEIYKNILSGIEEYATDYFKIFKSFYAYAPMDKIFRKFIKIMNKPTFMEFEKVCQIKFASDENDENYNNLYEIYKKKITENFLI